jgi:hypothetical protein
VDDVRRGTGTGRCHPECDKTRATHDACFIVCKDKLTGGGIGNAEKKQTGFETRNKFLVFFIK